VPFQQPYERVIRYASALRGFNIFEKFFVPLHGRIVIREPLSAVRQSRYCALLGNATGSTINVFQNSGSTVGFSARGRNRQWEIEYVSIPRMVPESVNERVHRLSACAEQIEAITQELENCGDLRIREELFDQLLKIAEEANRTFRERNEMQLFEKSPSRETIH
jgi:hypothetical protein